LRTPATVGVIIFEVLLNATSIFSHSNVRLPADLERRLRRILVTPDMHRVHHSIVRQETNSNFEFNLPWWDRLFDTYRAQPRRLDMRQWQSACPSSVIRSSSASTECCFGR